MFGARKGGAEGDPEIMSRGDIVRSENLSVSAPRAAVETSAPSPRMPVQITPRNVSEIPGRRRVHAAGDHDRVSSDGTRTLKVGKGLSVAGEITSCDVLVVEGKVEAKLNDGKMLEITESGQFRGSVEIENADIAGRYDGQLTVHGRLTVRSTGRVSGMVKYGELEINAGGQIIGEMQVTGGSAAATAPPSSFKGSAKFASYAEETEETPPRSERRSA